MGVNSAIFVGATSRELAKCEELHSKLFKVSGYTVEKLIELFAAGYRLIPPECKTMEEVAHEILYGGE